MVSANLVEQPYAPPFLAQIEQGAAARFGDLPQRGLQLSTAVAALAEQGIAGQAFGMQPNQHRLAIPTSPRLKTTCSLPCSSSKPCMSNTAQGVGRVEEATWRTVTGTPVV